MSKAISKGINMNEGRRESDHRFSKIEDVIDVISKDMVLVKTKIFNGFSHSILNTEEKVSYIDQQNKEDHKMVRGDIKDLSKKFDKLLWSLVGVSFLVLLSEIFKYYN